MTENPVAEMSREVLIFRPKSLRRKIVKVFTTSLPNPYDDGIDSFKLGYFFIPFGGQVLLAAYISGWAARGFYSLMTRKSKIT